MKKLVLLCVAALAFSTLSPASADELLSPSEFRQYAEGYTLYFERDGAPFGSESFEPGGQSMWRSVDGSCVAGAWRPYGGQICFYYGDATEVLCWRMIRDDQGLMVRLLGEGEDVGLELRIAARDRRELVCGEPGRGT